MELLKIVFDNIKTMTLTLYILTQPIVNGLFGITTRSKLNKFSEQKGGKQQKKTRKRMHKKKFRVTRKK